MCFINDERGKKKKKGGKRYFLFTWFKGDFLRAIKSRIATYMFYIYIYYTHRTHVLRRSKTWRKQKGQLIPSRR